MVTGPFDISTITAASVNQLLLKIFSRCLIKSKKTIATGALKIADISKQHVKLLQRWSCFACQSLGGINFFKRVDHYILKLLPDTPPNMQHFLKKGITKNFETNVPQAIYGK